MAEKKSSSAMAQVEEELEIVPMDPNGSSSLFMEADGSLGAEPQLDMSLVSEGVVGRVTESMGKWTKSLQHWVQDHPTDLRVNGEMPSYNQLVLSLEDHLQRQHRINQANMKLNSLNYMVGMANFAKNKTLQKHLEEGKMRILELRTQMKRQYEEIQHLQESIDALNDEVEDQRQKSDELQKSLHDTENRLKESLELYRQEVEQQKKLVEEQQRTVQRLTKTKFNQDFLLDIGFVVAALYIVNMSLIKYPLQLLTSIMTSKRRQQNFYEQTTKLLLCLFMVKYSRDQAQQLGFHNQVGSWYLYLTSFGSSWFSPTPAVLKGSGSSSEGKGKGKEKR